MWQYIVIILIGYLVGSINISVLVTKYIGKKDIRTIGSGNAGGTNVVRAMGAKWGITVIVLEILKGVIIGLFAKYVFPADCMSIGGIGPEISGAIAEYLYGIRLSKKQNLKNLLTEDYSSFTKNKSFKNSILISLNFKKK